MKVRMKVEGGDKIARRLQMLAEETARKHIREAALAGAEVIRKEAKSKVSSRTGTLADDMQIEVEKQTKARISIKIGPGEKAWYGRLLEEGHKLVRVTGRVRRGRRIYRLKRDLGHVPPYPFLRPAFDEKAGEAQDTIANELKRRLGL